MPPLWDPPQPNPQTEVGPATHLILAPTIVASSGCKKKASVLFFISLNIFQLHIYSPSTPSAPIPNLDLYPTSSPH